MPTTYAVQCYNCLSDFDAVEAIWCSCNPQRPTKVCPFCMGCFCATGEEFRKSFWGHAPEELRQEIATLSECRMMLGEMLVRAGLISTTQLLDALNLQKVDGRRLGEILVDSGALPPDRLEKFLQSQHTVMTVDVARARVDAAMLQKLGVERCMADRILPLEAESFRDRRVMTLAMADPSDGATLQRVVSATGHQVIPGAAPAEAIQAVIRSIFPAGSPPVLAPAHAAASPPTGEGVVAGLLSMAIRRRASHLHIQGKAGHHRVFFRIDGHLYLDRAYSAPDAARALSTLRDRAGLTAGRNAGRAASGGGGVEHGLIVRARAGRDGGDDLSVKLLDPVRFPPRLEELGFPDEVSARMRAALEQSRGLILISSPPFSGASSTFYALVMEAAGQGRPLALLESPRAVSLDGVMQEEFTPEQLRGLSEALQRAAGPERNMLAITPGHPLNWAGVLASLPERMLVIATIVAQTLHEALLILAADGYPAASLGSRPTLVIHQRLLRRLCPSCKAEASTAEEFASILGLPLADARRVKVWRGSGCQDCGPTPGIRGRVPIVRCMEATADVAAAVAGGTPRNLAAACRAAGLSSLQKEAIAAVAAGLTTPEEVAAKSP